MRNLANLEKLSLANNNLEEPVGCPTDEDGNMRYNSKEEVEAFFRCL